MTSRLTWDHQRLLARSVRRLRATVELSDGWPLYLAALLCHRGSLCALDRQHLSSFVAGDSSALDSFLGFSLNHLTGDSFDSTRREQLLRCVDALSCLELASVWGDDFAVGWVFQFFNDPNRKLLDQKVAQRGKIAPHEVASKTQLFTERYMCEWLVSNSLGALWRGHCRSNDWAFEPPALWVDRPHESCASFERVRDIRILDPAVGTGNFLLVAFDFLMELYRRESRARCERWDPATSAKSIVENNLFGLDLDQNAVKLARVLLLWKAWAHGASPRCIGVTSPIASPDLSGIQEWGKRWNIKESAVRELVASLSQLESLGSLSRISDDVRRCLELTGALDDAKKDLQGVFSAIGVQDDLPLVSQPSAMSLITDMLRPGCSHVVVANPPYLGIKKLGAPGPLETLYPNSKADLFSVFIERGEELVCVGGFNAMVTLHNWMFLSSFSAFRSQRAEKSALEVCAHMGLGGGFSGWSDNNVVMQTVMFVYRRGGTSRFLTRWLRLDSYSNEHKAMALRQQENLIVRPIDELNAIPDRPLVYWWGDGELDAYLRNPKLSEVSPVRQGLATSDNKRFLRYPWEVPRESILQRRVSEECFEGPGVDWVPFVKGAAGKAWFEPLSDILSWRNHGLEVKLFAQQLYGSYTRTIKNEPFYFRAGVSYSTIGADFYARQRIWQSVFDVSGSAVFPSDPDSVVCLLNSERARSMLRALNPTANFQVGDINRLAVFPMSEAKHILAVLRSAYLEHLRGTETSVLFERPGNSTWDAAQTWAQRAVDRDEGAPLPVFEAKVVPPDGKELFSYEFGCLMGRFKKDGIDVSDDEPGAFFIGSGGVHDSLMQSNAAGLHRLWEEHGARLSRLDLRGWLKHEFFKHDHLVRYRKRPVYLPLSSSRRRFVLWVQVAELCKGRLRQFVSRWLVPARAQLSAPGELEELDAFLSDIEALLVAGPPVARVADPIRERDHPLVLSEYDGVRVTSSAFWSLLEPQWKEPKKWWSELCRGAGRTDCDWSALASLYFPTRVREKCAANPSISAAHGRLWQDHPHVAHEWECRFTEEFGREVRIEERGAARARAEYEALRA